jgi:hypothetical protein
VSKSNFDQFLETLYPPGFSVKPLRTRSKDEWVSVLKVASLWKFETIRDFAIEKLEPFIADVNPVEKSSSLDNMLIPSGSPTVSTC